MGQATVDLPDPLEPATAPATPAGADDLLAQLAGDEIDRLLAEAEVEQETTGPARSIAADAAFDAALQGAGHSESNSPSAAPMATQENLPVVATSAASPAAPSLSDQMQQVFAGVTPIAPPQPLAVTIVESAPVVRAIDAKVIDTPVIDTQITTAASSQPVVATPVDGGTSIAERDGLRAGEIEALNADPLGELEDPDPEVRVPLMLKPLVWINAPFAAVPESVREALGKVAIITLVNAIGVLAYVLIFRKH